MCAHPCIWLTRRHTLLRWHPSALACQCWMQRRVLTCEWVAILVSLRRPVSRRPSSTSPTHHQAGRQRRRHDTAQQSGCAHACTCIPMPCGREYTHANAHVVPFQSVWFKCVEQEEAGAVGLHSFRVCVLSPCCVGFTPSPCQVAIVGKGLTFDSGGYNLKAGAGSMIELMKFDMVSGSIHWGVGGGCTLHVLTE